MTHADLVRLAERWLQRQRCAVVVTELVSAGVETPDALGWQRVGDSLLVECKTTRQDFRADAGKPFRRWPDMGIGDYRYYLCPEGLLTTVDMPPGWGLLSANGDAVTRIQVAQRMPLKNEKAETTMLLLLARRLARGQDRIEGAAVKAYVYDVAARTRIVIE